MFRAIGQRLGIVGMDIPVQQKPVPTKSVAVNSQTPHMDGTDLNEACWPPVLSHATSISPIAVSIVTWTLSHIKNVVHYPKAHRRNGISKNGGTMDAFCI